MKSVVLPFFAFLYYVLLLHMLTLSDLEPDAFIYKVLLIEKHTVKVKWQKVAVKCVFAGIVKNERSSE